MPVSESRIETTKGLCVVAMTKHLMKRYQKPQEEAYKMLVAMEIYHLLMDDETRLFLETNEYLCRCCDIECDDGKDALYEFINSEYE